MQLQTDTLLLALLLFQLKHFVCDFLLQSYATISKKGIYLHPVGLAHAGIHAIGSLPALLVLTHAPTPIIELMAAEFVVHYHVDWLKANVDKWFKLDTTKYAYWAIFGADQLAHQLTYIAMTYAIVRLG